MSEKIRYGLIGANLSAPWASVSHMPALVASADVELTAVCTTRRESAEEARVALGAKYAFDDLEEMVVSPEIDAVASSSESPTISKRRRPRSPRESTSSQSGRWAGTPPRRSSSPSWRERGGVQHVVGLQARLSPTLMYVKELIESGYLGEVLTYNVSGFRPGGRIERPAGHLWSLDDSNGANAFTIQFGHVVDALRFVAGEFTSVRGTLITQTSECIEEGTGRRVPVTAPDHVIASGRLDGGAVASLEVAAAPWAGTGFRMEIYGRDGTLVVTNSVSPQRGEASRLRAARGGNALSEMEIPDRFNLLPPGFPEGDPFNVGQLYHQFAEAIRTGDNQGPSFDTVVELHRLLDAIRLSSDSGHEVSCDR